MVTVIVVIVTVVIVTVTVAAVTVTVTIAATMMTGMATSMPSFVVTLWGRTTVIVVTASTATDVSERIVASPKTNVAAVVLDHAQCVRLVAVTVPVPVRTV